MAATRKAPQLLGTPMGFDEGDGITGTATLNSVKRSAKAPSQYGAPPKRGYTVVDVTITAVTGTLPSNPIYWELTSEFVYRNAK